MSVKGRLAAIKRDWDANEEQQVLNDYLKLIEKESAASKKVKQVRRTLDSRVASQYAKLGAEEVKLLVVEDKWMGTLDVNIQTELDRISQALTTRTMQLAERYANPLPTLNYEVEALSAKVDEHLERMGFAWK